MRRIRKQDTAPELLVRRALHAAGLRFRVHDRSLPGTPDIVLRRRRTVVFVHGCFWHGHDCARGRIESKRNTAFWTEKLAGNRQRDRAKSGALRRLGWRVETVWECRCADARRLDRLCEKLLAR